LKMRKGGMNERKRGQRGWRGKASRASRRTEGRRSEDARVAEGVLKDRLLDGSENEPDLLRERGVG
jgi:hypothetical protein